MWKLESSSIACTLGPVSLLRLSCHREGGPWFFSASALAWRTRTNLERGPPRQVLSGQAFLQEYADKLIQSPQD